MTKVIFIATLSLLSAVRAAGVPVMPAALEPRLWSITEVPWVGLIGSVNRLAAMEFPSISEPVNRAELRPARESAPFPAVDWFPRAAVLSSTSVAVARRPQTHGRGRREPTLGPRHDHPRWAQAWLHRKQP
jgi:hypothetical protein